VGGVPGVDASYAEAVAKLPKELGIADRVVWVGEYAWDSEDASVYLRAADLCVLPFDIGVYLNNSSFAAAAVHELPIITTRGPTLEAPFLHAENVWLCPPKDPAELAAAIETLIDDPELRRRLGRGSGDLARTWFTWNRAVGCLVEMLDPPSSRPRG
jgi:glycosyltransferase involved in cell wall biosynthesis